jgi:hypothetical protein
VSIERMVDDELDGKVKNRREFRRQGFGTGPPK